MKVVFIWGVVIAVLLMGSAVGAQEPLVLYDSVGGKTPNAEKEYAGPQTDSGMVAPEMGRQNPRFGSPRFRQASALPDLSGLVWLDGDRFLAVHDAKVDGESGNPRASLIYLPADSQGVHWKRQGLDFHGLKSNDLESAARIPGTMDVLLAESGDNGNPRFQRIFKARVEDNQVRIINVTPWPVSIHNVEATAVAALGDRFVFLFAERAQNLSKHRFALGGVRP